jgi:formylglycine-generating enzyme required for sulfatase activity
VPKEGVYIGVDPRELPNLAVFRDVDASWCPEMVVIPAGQFLMGSPPDEPERLDFERPQHRVTIGYRFAIGRYAGTMGEYRRFVEATDRDHTGIYVWSGSEWKIDASKSWRDPGFAQTDRHPVVGVSWQDAQAYVEWLSRETGQAYRLPSEAEWEYACRAGTTTPYSFGETITTGRADYDGNYTYAGGPKGEYRQRTVPVGSFSANAWGLHEMHGNVWEWVEDVWHDGYNGYKGAQVAPANGAAWISRLGKQGWRNRRVNRGRSWRDEAGNLRSAFRNRFVPGNHGDDLGFRLARTLD